MLEGGGGPALTVYRIAGQALKPFVPLLLAYRTRKGKEDPARRGERYGLASVPRPTGPVVWIHAASVGETNAVLPLVERIVAGGRSVVFTTVTVTSAGIAARRLPAGAVHQYAPLDIAPFVERFLDHWRPDLAIFVESELWPATMSSLGRRGIAQIRVNARMSERSFARWSRFGSGLRDLFSRVTLALAQSEGDGVRLRGLGMPAVRVTGNIKLDVPPPDADPTAVEAFRALVPGRSIAVAASTHEGEEEIVAAAHRQLRASRPELLTIIAPRHPVRGPALRDQLAARGFNVALRSRGEPVEDGTDLYIADTLGELGIFYRVAPVAFIGGTLVPIGGHNPIEAVRLGTVVLHGPSVASCAEIYAALDAASPIGLVSDAAELAAALDALFADPALMRRHAEAATSALAPYAGALDTTLQAIEPYLTPVTAASPADGSRSRP